ncbi:DUF2797 domain-containing protein [Streptomyces melanogenes]|uniref:DUF2797 domain-containing protein n=1 Tax=Streptomyces melanogenes TaxID=67326 RepID=UPI0027E41A34|nr:DUF2797 domain-containing protein [Streptomyces melanogenes]
MSGPGPLSVAPATVVDMAGVWRSGGVRWGEDGPGLVWVGERGERRVSRIGFGGDVGFRVVGERRCVGARGNACPGDVVVARGSAQARCGECARLDRVHSVAADGVPDDPRVYRVYLAWFGPGLVKVGITAEEREGARLREQGAVCFSWLGRGPLMAARRCEELLRAALGVPDRVSYEQKRVVRATLPGPDARADEIRDMHARSVRLGGWPESLEAVACRVVDHGRLFGLDGLVPAHGVVRELAPDGVVGGRVLAAAGPDLHLEAEGRVVVLDTRLMSGWGLGAAPAGGGSTVPVRALRPPDVQDQLF